MTAKSKNEGMISSRSYISYPGWIVMISSTASLTVYAAGSYILYCSGGWMPVIIYIGFIAYLEVKLLKNHCVNCFYWGRTCGFGKGKISSWFFRNGYPERFCSARITWRDVVPDLLAFTIPFVTGIAMLIIDFTIEVLGATLLLLFLVTLGNGYIRRHLTCKYCRQRELGCPADKMFRKQLPPESPPISSAFHRDLSTGRQG